MDDACLTCGDPITDDGCFCQNDGSELDDLRAEVKRLRDAFTWSLRHTSGKELRRMVGDLQDTSDLDEFIRAIARAESK